MNRPSFGPMRFVSADDSLLLSLEGSGLRSFGHTARAGFFISGFQFNPELEVALDEVCDVTEEHGHPGWDGEGASPVLPVTVNHACKFLLSLPLGVTMPEAGAHRDGEVSFSWRGGRSHMLTMSIGPTGRISYAFMQGARRKNGTEWFTENVPTDLLSYIRTFAR